MTENFKISAISSWGINPRPYGILCSFPAELARRFGLTPEEFGENLRDNYQRHDIDQDPAEPTVLAEEFLNK